VASRKVALCVEALEDRLVPATTFVVGLDQSLWANSTTAQTWTVLSPPGTILACSPSTDSSGADEVFALAKDHSLWVHNTAGWALLSAAGTITGMAASPGDVVFALAGNASLWQHSGAAGWAILSPASTILSISAGSDANGAEVFAIPSDESLWQHNSTGWSQLSPGGTILSVSAVGNTAFAIASDGSLWQYNSGGWALLSPANTIVATSAGTDSSGNPAVFALTENLSLYRYTAQGWQLLSGANTMQSITGSQGQQVFVVAADDNQWEFDGSAWTRLYL
jgi:hypothetical protein